MGFVFSRGGVHKSRVISLPDGPKISTLGLCAFIYAQYHNVTDGRRDGRTETVNQDRVVSILMRDKHYVRLITFVLSPKFTGMH